MKNSTLRNFLVSSIFLLFVSCAAKAGDPKTAMENSYKAFVEVMETKDAATLKNIMSMASYMKMKNTMMSAKTEFPKAFFEGASYFNLNFSKLNFIKVLENGPTGNMIYYDPKEEHVVILKFLKENDTWKFFEMSIYGTNELVKKIKTKDLSFLEDEKFKPSGILPVAEKEITNVDYMAMLDRSGEYKISIWVNGVTQDPTKGGSKSGLLMGGVKKGKNTIEIKLESLGADKGGSISVSIRAKVGETQNEVFTLKEETPALNIKKEFTVQ